MPKTIHHNLQLLALDKNTYKRLQKAVIIIKTPRPRKLKFSTELNKKLNRVKTLNFLRKTTQESWLEQLYTTERRNTRIQIRNEKVIHYTNQIERSSNKPKTLWLLVNSVLNRSAKGSKSVTYEGRSITRNDELCHAFAEFFERVIPRKLEEHFGQRASQACSTSANVPESMYLKPVTSSDICCIIDVLQTKKATGYDEVPAKFIKQCKNTLAHHLAESFNDSLQRGAFPDALKLAVIIPVPKKGNLTNIENFRPIALLTIFSKIFEKLLAQQLLDFLNKHHLITECQHGFRKNRSTETAATAMIQNIMDHLNNGKTVYGIFFDILGR
ncbi:hypothetical protein PPYR_00138 [Photinus pyralis]|uniref:Uncharacterized protein n=2 Tax=Photinus pyralis TaxID=7054 RepID=A0A5N4B0X2_PHOPY|nr:hypothetical protein PPYR_00138 [Photinus pyralis]